MKQRVTLDRLAKSICGRIVLLDVSPSEAQRLMEMGLVKGTPMRVLRRAPFGDPIQLEVRGTSLSLRRETATHITVEVETAP